MRLDQYVSEKSELSRNKAQALIKSGNVNVEGKTITKVGLKLEGNEIIIISKSEESSYVARSALKLKYFLEYDDLYVENLTCMDIGSSTGGFCQVLLENNVKKIYAIDVGTSQLHDSIRNNNKVISVENTDIRKLNNLDDDLDLITCDVSFISLDLIIDSIINHMSQKTVGLILFKPQFEVGSKNLNKKGVVKDKKISIKMLNNFVDLCEMKGLNILKIEESRLKGEHGNEEIVIKFIKNN